MRLTLFALCLLSACAAPASSTLDWKPHVRGYLQSLAKPDGAYGWADQPDSHLTPTSSVIACFRILGESPPVDRTALAEFVRTAHPYRGPRAETVRHAAELKTFLEQQIRSLQALGEDVSSFKEEARKWIRPSSYPASYEKSGFPIFQQEVSGLVCRKLLGLAPEDVDPAFVDYVRSRRRPNGSFNNTPGSDGSDGNLLNTLWGLEAHRALDLPIDRMDDTAVWIRACRGPGGGFLHQPGATIGALADVAYAWAAVRTGISLGDTAALTRYLHSLWNHDGGFGFRPGLPSDPTATFYALEALQWIGGLESLAQASRRPPPDLRPLPGGLKAFTIQIEAPGQGSPDEAVELARALRIHLWGAKNSKPEWIARAQAIAKERGVPVTFFVSDEEYGTYVGVPGLGVYSHLVDLVAPAGADLGPSMAGKSPLWPEFAEKRIQPLERGGGFLVWQICDNEELSLVLLDEAVRTGAYRAISTFHMRQNFQAFLPFVERYRNVIPFVSLQDAHGREPWWWTDDLAGYRTVFLAHEPTWAGWLNALRENRVVSVRHDEVTRGRQRMLGGAPGVQEFVRRRASEWNVPRRPDVAVTVVKPDGPFEAARPARGVTIRVRPAWKNNPQGRPVQALTELVSLSVDGVKVEPTLTEVKDDKGLVWDLYWSAELPELKAGNHRVEARVRRLDTRSEARHLRSFILP